MKPDSNIDKKSILRNPVATYQQLGSLIDKKTLRDLEIWSETLEKLQFQLDHLQEQKNRTSGKFKQKNLNAAAKDDLKRQMQTVSKQLKQLNAEKADLETRILNVFTPILRDKNNPSKIDIDFVFARTPDSQETNNLQRYTIQTLTSTEVHDWNQYVADNPSCTNYHRAEWKDLIENVFGHECIFLFARDKSSKVIVGILPLVYLSSRIFGRFLISMPYFNYGGARGDHTAIELDLMAHAESIAMDKKASHIEYRDNQARKTYQSRTNKVNMVLPLPKTSVQLWESIPSKLRSQIKRPQRENTEVIIGQADLIDDFYKVFSHNMRDLGTPVYSKAFFNVILETFADQTYIIVVKIDNQPAAAGFFMGHRNKVFEIPWASTIRKYNNLSVNMLLYWEALKFAVEHKYTVFDFGRSSKDAGTYRFKKQWGAKPIQCHWHYWLGEQGELPELNPSNKKFQLAIKIWQKLPIKLTQLIGPGIVKNLP